MRKHIAGFVVLTLLLINHISTLFAQGDLQTFALPEGAITRIGNGNVYSVAYTPDGTRLAVATSIGIWIYNTINYNPISLLGRHDAPIHILSFSSDGRLLVSSDIDGTVQIWNTQTDEYKRLQKVNRKIACLAISPDGKRIATANSSDKIRLWDTQTGTEIKIEVAPQVPKRGGFNQKGDIISLAFSPDGNILVSGDHKSEIIVWDSRTGIPIQKYISRPTQIKSLDFSPDGKSFVSCGRDGSINLWDIPTGQLTQGIRLNNQIGATKAKFSLDGILYIASGSNIQYYKFDADTVQQKRTITGHTRNVSDFDISPDMHTLASISFWDGSVRIWDTETGGMKHILSDHYGEFLCFDWSADGKTIITPAVFEYICLWDATTGNLNKKTLFNEKHPNLNDIVFNPNADTFAIGTSENLVSVWDTKTGNQKMTLTEHTGNVICVDYSPDGKTLVSAGVDRSVRLWDAETGELKSVFDGHKAKVLSVAFSPDGKSVASAGTSSSVMLWDAETHEINPILIENRSVATDIAFSPDGKRLAAVKGLSAIFLWDLETGVHRQLKLADTLQAVSVAFSPDSLSMVVGCIGGVVAVLDVGTGAVQHRFIGNIRRVDHVAFAADGKSVVSNSKNGGMYLWGIEE